MSRSTKRKTKHRGNAAGMIERRGVTHASSGGSRSGGVKKGNADPRLREPSWRGSFIKALVAAGIFAVVMLAVLKGSPAGVLVTTVLLLGVYTPFGYYFDRFLYRRRLSQLAAAGGGKSRR